MGIRRRSINPEVYDIGIKRANGFCEFCDILAQKGKKVCPLRIKTS